MLMKEKGSDRIRLSELLSYRANIFGSNPGRKDVSRAFNYLTIFEIYSENYIKFKSRFEKHLNSICNKARLYWEFVSGIYSRKETFKSGIEGEIKKGILLYNEGFYFECHEFLEEVWKKESGDEKAFLKGLIHAAVAFYHLEYENYKGTINYITRSYKRLKEFEPVFLGVDIKVFLTELEGYLRHLEKSGFHNHEFLKTTIPTIRLVE
jgi:hypothetical protein